MKYLALTAILAACDGKPGQSSESRIERAKDCQLYLRYGKNFKEYVFTVTE